MSSNNSTSTVLNTDPQAIAAALERHFRVDSHLTGSRPAVIVTHDSKFHADDLFAMAVFVTANPVVLYSIEIQRSRDPEVIARGSVVFDVGGKYGVSPDGKVYLDHHQADFDKKRPNGGVYAAAGLVWLHYGKIVVRSILNRNAVGAAQQFAAVMKSLDTEEHVADIHQYVDDVLFAALDAYDNGKPVPEGLPHNALLSSDLSAMLSSFNIPWYAGDRQTQALHNFVAVVTHFAYPMLVSTITARISVLAARGFVSQEIEKQEGSKILVLEEGLPWGETLLDHPKGAGFLFVVYPGEDGTWYVQAINSKEDKFSKRKPLPAPWGGLRCKEEAPEALVSLPELTGVPDAVFCHKGLFLAGARSKEGVLRLAQMAVEYQEETVPGNKE